MKRIWTRALAFDYVAKVVKKEMVKGLKYWSAIDYLNNIEKMNMEAS